MESWENRFVHPNPSWGRLQIDLPMPDQWVTGKTATGMTWARARWLDGPAAATQMTFTPDNVLWSHWHEVHVAFDEGWALNTGSFTRDRFLSLVKARMKNLDHPVPRGPGLAALARVLMWDYISLVLKWKPDGYVSLTALPESVQELLAGKVW